MGAQVGVDGPAVKPAARIMVDEWLTGIPDRPVDGDSVRIENAERSQFPFLLFSASFNHGSVKLSLGSERVSR